MAALVLPIGAADAQSRGPESTRPSSRAVHAAPASLDSTGAPDSWFVVRPGGAHDPLPADGNVAATVTLPDGRVFTADFALATPLVLEESPHERTTLRWSMFARPGEAKKIFGAHLFTTARADGLVSYACVFSNGACKAGVAGSFAGAFYFTDLRLELRERGRKLYAELRAGESIENDGRTFVIVTGKGSWIPPRAQFTRRAVSYKRTGLIEKSQQREARAALDLADLVLPARLDACGTQKLSRASEKSSADTASRLAALRSALARGAIDPAVYRSQPVMGPFAPLFDDQAGEVGGAGINPVAAPELSTAAALWHRFAGDCVSERMPIAAYNADTGVPMTPERWARGGASQGFEYRSTRGWDGIVQIPEFAASSQWVGDQLVYTFREFNSGSCSWRSAILEDVPIDGAHLSRASKDDQASWLLSHDWAAWLRARMLAADISCVQSLRGKRPLIAEYAGQWVPYSLEKALRDAHVAPGHGIGILREMGWSMDAIAWGGMLPATGEHAELVLEARGLLDLAATAALPNGICTDGHLSYGSDNGIPWNDDGLPATSGEAPQFQVPIFDNGVFGLANAIGRTDPLAASALVKTVVRAAENQYFGTVPFIVSEYTPGSFGPPWYLVTTENGAPCVPIAKGVGKSHVFHGYHDLALAYLSSGDRKFLDAMTKLGVPTPSLEARLAALRGTTTDRGWFVLPQTVLEQAGVR